MTDLHSHVLPKIDDGASSVDESLALLSMLREQGVKTVAATPHLYFRNMTVSSFLEKRAASYAALAERLSEITSPRVILGAEVEYFQGISRMSELLDLRIEGSELLLIEMPCERWSEYTVREITELSSMSGIVPMIAHVERCIDYQPVRVLNKLIDSNIIMQANASFFAELKTRRKALKFLKKGIIQAVASDCHNLRHRPPRLSEAVEVISHKFGAEFVSDMTRFADGLVGIE